MKIARRYGTIISYDLNYRPSLWKSIGGIQECTRVNQKIANYVDVMIGFPSILGFEVNSEKEDVIDMDVGAFKKMIELAVAQYPNFKTFAATIRHVKTATVND